ncbi:MAG: NAD(P)H-dependent glycerol-3-phosphate dehydrogenase [Rickettsiaceae bacterium]|nr:NAD(P)H-dependent glycerol-3-phosphate dehydrogenase [Rickettsiaceae bacterium]
MQKSFTVIGGGSWGTALACLVARATGKSGLYVIENNTVDEINNNHQNKKYLGDIVLPSGIKATSDITNIISSDVIIIAVPSYAFESTLLQIKDSGLRKDTTLLIATKGLCENPSQLFSDKIEQELDNVYAFISGPNFAKEVAEDKFTSITISSKNIKIAKEIADILKTPNLDVTTSDDIITVQIASIVKNIVAIKSGILQASGFVENAKAWLISNGLQEISSISKRLGGKAETLCLPAVIGDLLLTCYSVTSRNTKFGYEFHQNNYSKDFLNNYPILVEGVSSARLLSNFLKAKQIELNLPIIKSIATII